METFDWFVLFGIAGIIWNQTKMNEKLDHIYTEVTEIHNKMGGWFSNHEKE